MPFGPLNSLTTIERSLSTWLKEKKVWEMTPSSTFPAKYLGPMTRAGSTYEGFLVRDSGFGFWFEGGKHLQRVCRHQHCEKRNRHHSTFANGILSFVRISFMMSAAHQIITSARRFFSNSTLKWHSLPCAAIARSVRENQANNFGIRTKR